MNPVATLVSVLSLGAGLLFLPVGSTSEPDTALPKGGKYIGAQVCKSCHAGAEKGDAHGIWSKSPHAKAFETLASDKAKEIAKKAGIEDAQKSEKCLKCHVTAYGLTEKEIKKGFKPELGVQCESCHGPGETHQKTRMAEAMKKDAAPSPVTEAEIKSGRSADLCKTCHNPESPTFKPPFCIKESMAKIEHLDPRQKRSEEDIKKLREGCAPDCEKCKAEKKDAK
ncbi:MAG: hypothetical protein FJ265_09935 [Planctomycetes bacterium]|nr:hypothetical protein [Planctomycetota bacterium]